MIADSTNVFTGNYYRQVTPSRAEGGGFEQANAISLFPFGLRPMFVIAPIGLIVADTTHGHTAGAATLTATEPSNLAAMRRRRRIAFFLGSMRRR